MKLRDVLELTEWGMREFGSIVTNRLLPRRDMMLAVKLGYCRSLGDVALCDDDGCVIQPERYREGFVLTDAGREKLAALVEEEEEE